MEHLEEVLKRLNCIEKMITELNTNVNMVYIPKLEYERLQEREDWLRCLEVSGVDNWQGMEEAIRIHNEE